MYRSGRAFLVFAASVLSGVIMLAGQGQAETIQYTLTFTPTSGSATGGTGTLTIDEPSIPTTLNLSGSSAQFVSLTATVDAIPFTFSASNVFSIGMSGGVWNNISANSNQTAEGGFSFSLGTGGLTYNLQEINVAQIGGGTISVGPATVVSATPLPATLPLLVGGLGFLGYLAWRGRGGVPQVLAAA
jgi:hypothetical protein